MVVRKMHLLALLC